MKHILVTQRLLRNRDYPEERDALDVRWATFLHAAGLLPTPVPSGVDVDAFLEGLSFDGLLLTGGNDLSSLDADPLNVRRDALESALCERVEHAGLPILGVCRGMQFLAARHGLRVARHPGHAGTRHPIRVIAESPRLGPFDGVDVNSFHTAGVSGAAADLILAARAPDGSVEAIEHVSHPVLGILWHPERESPTREKDLDLFRSFFCGTMR